ncbi:unnamed protein product [Microthlaspi erraticum]|uniref:F-box domain-containing protein n=1 Tax=Microthlaspi erraticum TaxID=1685480 RepID=A0A6D2HHS1_9BRAS|nr:unnamed protein product [Microthlaspi erraticum]
MTKISNLPLDLVTEILSSVPLTSLRAVRFTCKKWNTLSQDRSFIKKHLAQLKAAMEEKEFLAIMVMDFRVYLMNINLRGDHKDDGNVVKRQGKLISLDDADRVDISRIFHCDGLVLCITQDINNSRLVVWNPYSGRTRSIQPRNSYRKCDMYGFGYEMKNKSVRIHKILRFVDKFNDRSFNCLYLEFEIFNLDSNTWKVVDLSPGWEIKLDHCAVSLKGNTYWLAQEILPIGEEEEEQEFVEEIDAFLICFDFTRERFGPRLSLPFQTNVDDYLTLSSVGEEQLAVLRTRTVLMEFWVTTKIEPEVVSWKKLFVSEDTNPLNSLRYDFTHSGTPFFIEQGNKVAVVFDQNEIISEHNIAYIIGEYGYVEEVDLGVGEFSRKHHHYPHGCSYVPSSMQIKQGGKRKKELQF